MNNKTEVQTIRKFLIGTKFFIKEHRNNFIAGSIIDISYKVDGTSRKNQLFMFNEKDFTIDELKVRLDEALMSNEPIHRNFRQEYYELDEILTQLYRDLSIEEVLEN